MAKLLDLFCGAGGAAMGYSRAGFRHIVGVDSRPQPNYPFRFVQGDALKFLVRYGHEFDVIHASPPCQAYSAGSRMRNGYAKDHPKLIEPLRFLLQEIGVPYVIENVPGASLTKPTQLCGSSFNLLVRRHRHFESNLVLRGLPCFHKRQLVVIGVYGDHPEDCYIRKGHPARRARSIEQAQEALGITWTEAWRELKEAIPPAYTKFIGRQLL